MLPSFMDSNSKTTGIIVVGIGIVTALVVWAIVRLLGVDLEVGRGDDMSTVGAVDVIVASLIGGLAAWGVHALMAKWGIAARWWPFVGSTALAISISGPGWYADGAAAVALIVMHFAVAIVLITGFSRQDVAEACRPSSQHSPSRTEG